MPWFKKKHQYLIITLTLLIVVGGLFFINKVNEKNSDNKKMVKIKEEVFVLELAKNSLEHYLGLSFRDDLCDNCGMLFLFEDSGQRSFVMREMNFPLDIIFLNDGLVATVYENLPPEGSQPENIYTSTSPSNQVLELRAGQVARLGLRVGDYLDFNNYE